VVSHRKTLTVGATAVAVATFVAAAFFTGFFGALGGSTADKIVGRAPASTTSEGPGPTKSPGLPVDIHVETDMDALPVAPKIWTVPRDAALPKYTGDCYSLDAWGQQQTRAMPTEQALRLTLTGHTPTDVVVHRVWAKVIDRDAMPSDQLSLVCASGGPIDTITAFVPLVQGQKTTYADLHGEYPHLAYSLEQGEAGVFLVRAHNLSRNDVVTWDLMVEFTVGSRREVVNINETRLAGKHFVTSTACGTERRVWAPGQWVSEGPAPCVP
jgi:hypothetical protein